MYHIQFKSTVTYMLLRNLSFPAAVVKVVLLSIHLSTALVVRFGISISNGHKQKTLLPEFPAALNTFKFKTQNALAQTENVSYPDQKHRYIHVAEKPVFSSCSCQSCPVVCPLVNCAGCAVRHFNQQWAQAKTLLPEFPAALNTFKFKTQNALAQTENVSYLVQKHRYIYVAEKPVFSSCSCQSCPVVCPLVNCAGCAVRHCNQQWAQAKDTLARVSRGIEHIQVQDAECSSTNRKCIISSSRAPLHTCC